MKIGGYSLEAYLAMARDFHGHAAPGMLLGGFMVDALLGRLSLNRPHDAICETRKCLPDAVQLLTPCTLGNGWLRVVDVGRFALTLYDKEKGTGMRVYVAPSTLVYRPQIRSWLFKAKKKKEQDSARLMAEIRTAGAGICRFQHVRVDPRFLGRAQTGGIGICPGCNEGYPLADGDRCRACTGEALYEAMTPIPNDFFNGRKPERSCDSWATRT